MNLRRLDLDLLQDYYEERLVILLKHLENAAELTDVYRAQGRLQELRYLLEAVKQAKKAK